MHVLLFFVIDDMNKPDESSLHSAQSAVHDDLGSDGSAAAQGTGHGSEYDTALSPCTIIQHHLILPT